MPDTVQSVFFRPPLAIARIGGSDTPLDSFVWSSDSTIHGAHRTVIRPAVSLEVLADGSANHPDVVLGELYPGEALPPTGDARRAPAADEPAETGRADQPAKPAAGSPSEGERIPAGVPLDWIHADRSRALAAEAQGTIAKNRPYQLDAFEINSAWQALSIVLEGRESGGPYVPQTIETANPFASPKELANKLTQTLAPLKVTLTLEYLYARFSLLSTDEARKTGIEGLPGAVMLARDRLMLIAVSEMRHLRWVRRGRRRSHGTYHARCRSGTATALAGRTHG